MVDVVGAGDLLVDVTFPVWFTEKPYPAFGGELAEGFSPEPTNFPTVSVVVATWTTMQRGLGKYWTGASLAIVTTGAADHRMVVDWQMTGKAMANPVTPGTSIESAL